MCQLFSCPQYQFALLLKALPNPGQGDIHASLLSGLLFIFTPIILLDLIFKLKIEVKRRFFKTQRFSYSSTTYREKVPLPSPLPYQVHHKSAELCVLDCFHILFWWPICPFLLRSHDLSYCNFVISCDIWQFKSVLGIHTSSLESPSYFSQNSSWHFDWNCIESRNKFGENWNLCIPYFQLFLCAYI